jgi:hypothetical protein
MNEHELRTLLTKATEDRPAGIDLMPKTPGRRRIRVLVPIASLGVAAAVAVAVAVSVVLPVGQSSAQAQVLTAVENTSQESYRIHTTSGQKIFDGAFDPVQQVGVITRDGAETRFVGGKMYSKERGEAKWLVSPRAQPELENAPEVVTLVKLAPLDPQAALERLRSATDVRESGSASGQGWTGRRFAFSLEDTSAAGAQEGAKQVQGKNLGATGTVDVDDQGRVRRLEVDFSDDGHQTVLEIGDFGTPVTVVAPPADQVEQLPADQVEQLPTDKPNIKKS